MDKLKLYSCVCNFLNLTLVDVLNVLNVHVTNAELILSMPYKHMQFLFSLHSIYAFHKYNNLLVYMNIKDLFLNLAKV